MRRDKSIKNAVKREIRFAPFSHYERPSDSIKATAVNISFPTHPLTPSHCRSVPTPSGGQYQFFTRPTLIYWIMKVCISCSGERNFCGKSYRAELMVVLNNLQRRISRGEELHRKLWWCTWCTSRCTPIQSKSFHFTLNQLRHFEICGFLFEPYLLWKLKHCLPSDCTLTLTLWEIL